MSITTIRRRVGTLEKLEVFQPIREYPPFAPSEIETIASRIQVGERLALDEIRRLEQHCPIIEGELLVTAFRGSVFVKRYPGVDLGEI